MIAFKLAYKNLIGAGLRTWLNVFVLSLAYVLIIFFNGLMDGWNQQAKTDTIEWEIGGGVYWQETYDPYDPFTLENAHSAVPRMFTEQVEQGNIAPVLISQATIYPEGRMLSIMLKGITPQQSCIALPTLKLQHAGNEIPAIIGKRMAQNAKLKQGDLVTLRWRDANGTFDAAEIKVVEIFDSNVPSIDNNQVWIDFKTMGEMMRLSNEATTLITEANFNPQTTPAGWEFKDTDFLLSDITKMVQTKSMGSAIFYVIILALAMLAIFDTQVLAIFKRQKEIGTYIALGMTRKQVVGIFTFEGAFHAILAAAIGAVYGIPLFLALATKGMSMPEGSDDMGIPISEAIYPAYGIGLIASTIVLVFIITLIVSYLPARKISKMNPTDAIKGKVQ